MPRQCQLKLLFLDTASVVAHANQLCPARSNVDLDIVGAGVEAVLDEFLHNGGRPLDDLAGSDLVDQVAW